MMNTKTIRVAQRSTARGLLTCTKTHNYPHRLASLRPCVLPSTSSSTSNPKNFSNISFCCRSFSTTSRYNNSNGNGNGNHTSTSTLTDSQYHEIADQYLDKLLAALEAKAEVEDGFEVEYSAGVLSIVHKNGTYVINKQPPNKQIWLSSPVSGPKRYDWVSASAAAAAAGVHPQHEKEGTEFATGDDGRGGWWVYARDGGRLSALLKREVGVEVNKEDE